MIVRQHKEGLSRKYLFNIAGGGFVLLTVVLALKASLWKDDTPLCEARYPGGALFSLARQSGAPLTTAELQSRLGGTDWGIGDNTRVVEAKGAPTGYALHVDLRREAPSHRERSARRSGFGFVWMPRMLERAGAACLTYNIEVPRDFHAGLGGRLPAIVGGAPDRVSGGGIEDGKGLAVSMAWRSDLGLDAVWEQADEAGRRRVATLDYGKLKLQPGRWLRIDQEIVLNDPKQRNGIMRIWVDGKLRLERSDIRFRDEPGQHFLGIQADIHNTRTGVDWQPSMKDTWLRMSPLELRLQ